MDKSNQQNGRSATAVENNSVVSTVGYLVVGLGIGAGLSILLAPQSGRETRKWIAHKCLDAVDIANKKVRESRTEVQEIVDRGQQQISDAVAASREAIAKTGEIAPN